MNQTQKGQSQVHATSEIHALKCLNVRSEKPQNESSPSSSNFRPEFFTEKCSEIFSDFFEDFVRKFAPKFSI